MRRRSAAMRGSRSEKPRPTVGELLHVARRLFICARRQEASSSAGFLIRLTLVQAQELSAGRTKGPRWGPRVVRRS